MTSAQQAPSRTPELGHEAISQACTEQAWPPRRSPPQFPGGSPAANPENKGQVCSGGVSQGEPKSMERERDAQTRGGLAYLSLSFMGSPSWDCSQ